MKTQTPIFTKIRVKARLLNTSQATEIQPDMVQITKNNLKNNLGKFQLHSKKL